MKLTNQSLVISVLIILLQWNIGCSAATGPAEELTNGLREALDQTGTASKSN